MFLSSLILDMSDEVELPSETIHCTNDVKTAWEYKERCFFLRLNEDGSVAQVASSFLQTNSDDVYFILEKHDNNRGVSPSPPLESRPKYFGLDQQASVEKVFENVCLFLLPSVDFYVFLHHKEIQEWMDKEGFWMIVDWPGHGDDSAWKFFNAVRRGNLDPRRGGDLDPRTGNLDPRTTICLTLTHPPPRSPRPSCMSCRLSN